MKEGFPFKCYLSLQCVHFYTCTSLLEIILYPHLAVSLGLPPLQITSKSLDRTRSLL